MKLVSIILVLMICVIAMAFWKDIKEMSARQTKPRKPDAKPAGEAVRNKSERQETISNRQ